jgi:Resolvase, N terminal domain
MGHLLGYARVSTTDQQPQLHVDALTAAGCYRVFTETASGARTDRPVLEQLLDQLHYHHPGWQAGVPRLRDPASNERALVHCSLFRASCFVLRSGHLARSSASSCAGAPPGRRDVRLDHP